MVRRSTRLANKSEQGTSNRRPRSSSSQLIEPKPKREKRLEGGPSALETEATELPRNSNNSHTSEQNMNDSVDYVAMVQQHLDDERLAQQIHNSEHGMLTRTEQESAEPTNGRDVPTARDIVQDIIRDIESDDDMDSDDDEQLDNLLLNARMNANMEQNSDDSNYGTDHSEDRRLSLFQRVRDAILISSEDEDDEVELTPQRRSGVLAAPQSLSLGNGRVSVHINGNRQSLTSFRNAMTAAESLNAENNRLLGGPEAFGEAEFNFFRHQFFIRDVTDRAERFRLFAGTFPNEVSLGLSSAQINRLPRTKATPLQCSGHNNSCTICMDEYEPNADLLTLPCFHNFHYQCVKPWFSNKHECPVCRADARKVD